MTDWRGKVAIVLLCLTICAEAGAFGFGFGFWPFRKSTVSEWIDLLPLLSWSAITYDFGAHDVGTATNATFTITNSGNDTAEDVATTVTGAGFRLYSSVTFGNISAGKTRVAKVAFTPTGSRAFSGFANYTAPNIGRTSVALSGTGVSADPYTTYFASDWAGTGVQDTTNPSGGIYTGWTNTAGTEGSNTGSKYVLTYDGTKLATRLEKTSLAGHNDTRAKFTLKFSTTTMGSLANPQIVTVRNTGGPLAIITISATASTVNRISLVYYNGTGPTTINSSYAFTPNVEYLIALRTVTSTDGVTANGQYFVDIDGANVISSPATTTPAVPTSVRLGMLYSDNNLTGGITLDDFFMGWK